LKKARCRMYMPICLGGDTENPASKKAFCQIVNKRYIATHESKERIGD
jgi:hypothetical protein